MEKEAVTSAVESILFAADRPITLDRLTEVFGEEAPSTEDFTSAIESIKQRYLGSEFGFELREAQGGFHFVTKAQNADIIRRFLETKPFRVGRSALETLAIIAYRQPITRAEIDQVRGIDSSHLMRTLIERGLVKMAGKAEVPGRPVQYCTTPKFLEVIGLKSISDLPPLTELDQLQGDTEDPLKTLEEGLDRFITEERETVEATAELDQEGLAQIDTLIESARRGSKEVYESAVHAQVAEANEEAVAAHQSQPRARKKKTVITFEELTVSTEETLAMPPLEVENIDPKTVN